MAQSEIWQRPQTPMRQHGADFQDRPQTTARMSPAQKCTALPQQRVLGDFRPAGCTNDEPILLPAEEHVEWMGVTDDINPWVPDCEVNDRFAQIVAEQAFYHNREYGLRDQLIAELETCAPYVPAATIPQPSLRNVTYPLKCGASACGNDARDRLDNCTFGDGSCGRECAADKEERMLAIARTHGNPNTGRVSSMIGISAIDANLHQLPTAYHRSSMNTDISRLYDNVQRQGPSGTMARTSQVESGGRNSRAGAKPMHDPTEKMLNSMWQDSVEQTWKNEFLDRRPPPFINPDDPSSRRLEEQSARSRAAYRAMNWGNGP